MRKEDLTGKKFNKLTVVKLDEEKTAKGKGRYWFCKCDCGNPDLISVLQGNLKTGHTKSCGCLQDKSRRSRKENLIGQKFGHLTVIEEDTETVTETNRTRWWCKCDCGNPEKISVTSYNLKGGAVLSCGCILSNKNKERRKYNRFVLSEDQTYYKVYPQELDKEDYFIIDVEDKEKIEQYYWYYSSSGYVISVTQKNGKQKSIALHRFLLNITDEKLIVDHKTHPHWLEKKVDNRKSNLRIATLSQNNMNRGLDKRNKSGITGVFYNSKTNKWEAILKANGIYYLRKSFFTKEEAIRARKDAEEKYFKDFAYDKYNK